MNVVVALGGRVLCVCVKYLFRLGARRRSRSSWILFTDRFVCSVDAP
jgi:hypothetical protein